MRLLHYSEAPLEAIHDVDPITGRYAGYAKPRGLWVSVEGENDWPWWCHAEKYRLERLAVVTEVILASDANICYLESTRALDAFDVRYTKPDAKPFDFDTIDWSKVAGAFDGIIIAPYQWERRLHTTARWYYTWDCASGCIWKARAISELRPIK